MYNILPIICERKECTDNPNFRYNQETVMIVEYRNLEMYMGHPVCSFISKSMREK
jgi:hypothetical protein